MAERRIEIVAPSRLHFGLLSFGGSALRQYGGLGVMIDAPATRITLEPSARLEIAGAQSERAEQFVRAVVQSALQGRAPACRITVHAAPRPHTGLGTGTQLGVALAAGIAAFCDLPYDNPATLATWAGRGERSAIGLYGFAQGGLLLEGGKTAEESVSPLVARVELPTAWRFVLLCPRGGEGLFGDAERAALAALPPVPRETTAELCRLAVVELLPLAAEGDFARFSEALYRYGHLAGMCYAERQGSAFATPQLAALVEWLRDAGVAGVGQSSWGPTLYALVPDTDAAESIVARVRAKYDKNDLDLNIAPINNHGATIQLEPRP